jgi:light-regulated signal transduction histidine kinase (bacteriophytochrome)
VHYKEGYAILEVEMVELPNRLFITMYEELKEDISAINEAADVISLSGAALAALKQRSGFDRIMIYKFDEAWNGTVIAESMEEGMEPYLGLRFPESDVPRQARQLYFRNPYRLIPDRDFNPVKLYPVINPVINTFSDLSDCNLRSVAGVHLEYLKNMGVMASMSTRILKNGQLWGLISCHHREAKMMSQEQCAVFELLSDVISARLSAIEHKEYALESEALNTELASIVERLYQSDSLSHALLQQEVADRLGASGLVLTTGEQPDRIGSAPGEQDITPLIFWLGSRHPNAIFSSRSLGADFEEAAQYKEHASGLLSIPVRSDKPAYLLAFRPELVEEVAWGGNPQEALQLEADGKTYHPRASFKKWQQTVSGSSKPWQEQELRFATALRHAINDYLLLR